MLLLFSFKFQWWIFPTLWKEYYLVRRTRFDFLFDIHLLHSIRNKKKNKKKLNGESTGLCAFDSLELTSEILYSYLSCFCIWASPSSLFSCSFFSWGGSHWFPNIKRGVGGWVTDSLGSDLQSKPGQVSPSTSFLISPVSSHDSPSNYPTLVNWLCFLGHWI